MKMANRLYISKEQIEELEEARKKNKNKKVDRRLKALLMHAQGEEHSKISIQTEYASTYISELAAKYVDKGISAIVGNNYRANRRNMSFEEEKALLDRFRKQAEEGQTIKISEIKKAYEETTGRSLEKSHGQIYRVLKRHGWRKDMPRNKNPKKASDKETASSKN